MPSASPEIEAALDAVVFDFDGVILESADVKTEAFRALFIEHAEAIDAIMDVHERNGGVSRFVKFDMIYRDILRRPLPPDFRAELGHRFEEMVVERVVSSAMVPGALEVLDSLRGRVPMAVVSGTPDGELHIIVARRGLGGYFVELHGGSREKRVIVGEMMRARGWRRERTVMVGDAMTDYAAAHHNDIPFIGRVAHGKVDPFPPGTARIPDLSLFFPAATAAVRAAAE